MAENEITIELLQQPEYVIQLNEQGPAGPQGEQGIQGEQGKQGIKGDKGDEGPRGYSGTITVGDVVMEGDQVIIENNGTPEDAILDFTFPNYNASPNTMLLDVDQEVPSHKTFLEDQGIKSPLLDIRTDRSKRGNGLIFIDKNGTQTAGIGPYVNNNGSPECRLIASNGSVSAFAGLGTTKDGQGFFEIPEPSATSDNRDAVTSHWVREFVKSNSTAGHMVGELVAFPVSTKYTPEGFIKPDGTEFTQGLFPDLYREYLTDHRWFDKSKIEVVGSPTITDDGIASGFSGSNFVKITEHNITAYPFTIRSKIEINSLDDAQNVWSFNNKQFRFRVDPTRGTITLFYSIDNSIDNFTAIRFENKLQKGDIVESTCIFEKDKTVVNVKINDVLFTKSLSGQNNFTDFASLVLIIGAWNGLEVFKGFTDLKQFSISVGGKEVYSPTANTLDTCTYEEYANEVNTYGACAKWAVDDVRNTFKVPFMPDSRLSWKSKDKLNTEAPVKGNGKVIGLTDGAGEFGTYMFQDNVKALPGIKGQNIGEVKRDVGHTRSDITVGITRNGSESGIVADLSNLIIDNNEKDIEVQWFIYVANAQIGESAIDWTRFTEAVESRAKTDLSNLTPEAQSKLGIAIKEAYINGTSGYNIYSNGYCEQWGRLFKNSDSVNTITFPKKFKDTNYIVLINHGISGTFNSPPNGRYADEPFNITVSSFQACTHPIAGLNYIQWKANGYLAEGSY